MKKISLLAVVAFSIGFASCKKDYTCTCNYSYPGSSLSFSQTTVYKNTSKKNALANCSNADVKDETSGQIIGTAACSLSK